LELEVEVIGPLFISVEKDSSRRGLYK